MKLGITVAGEHALPSAFTVLRGFENAISTAAECGYDGVELALKSADEINPDKLGGWLDKNHMEVAAISTGQVYADAGLYFTNPDKRIRRQAVCVFRNMIELAGDFGHKVNIGRVRGFRSEEQTAVEVQALLVETIRELCDYAKVRDVELLIEPVNRYETNLINNLDEGAVMLLAVERENCGLMPDTFHMNIEDAIIKDSLIRNRKWVKYVHLADSNRLAPGEGHLDFNEVFQALKEIGYDGWATVEIFPVPSARKAAENAVYGLRDYFGAGRQAARTFPGLNAKTADK